MVTLTEAVRAREALAGRLPLVVHVARAARVLARTRGGSLGADDILIDGGATVVLGARPADGAAGSRLEPATLGPSAGEEAEADEEDGATVTESPERAAVQSLGALLHFVLAGAFPGPEPLAELAAGAPAPLVAVAERALGREKGAVYVGPAELADDLERHIVPSRVSAPAVADPRAARRRRIALIAAASVAALLLAGIGLAWQRERRLRDSAVTAAEAARAARRQDSFVVAQAYADKAAALAADGVVLSAAIYSAAVLDKVPASDSRPQARALREVAEGHILAARLALVQGIDGDRDAGGGPVTAMAAVPRLVATSTGRGIKLWREKGEPAGVITGHADAIVALALAPNGAVLATGSRTGAIRLWDTLERRQLSELRAGGDPVADLAVAPVTSGLVAAAERGGAVTLFALGGGAGTTTRSLPAHRVDATAVAFSPDGDLLATGARDGSLALWNPASGALVGRLGGHNAAILDLAFAPDGHLLASAAADGSIRLWSPTERALVAGLTGHRAAVTSLGFSPDGTMLLSAAADGSVRGWFAADGQPALALDGHPRGAAFAAVTAAGLVVTAGADGHLCTWRLGGARALMAPAELTGAIAFAPDGSVVAAAAVDHKVHAFRVESGQPRPALVGHTSDIGAIAFSPDGTLVATAGDDGTARLWRAADGQPLSSLVGHKGPVEAVAFAPSGVIVATAGDDHTVRLWSSQGGQTLGVLDEHQDRVVDVAFSPDGKRLAAVGWDGLVQLWTMQKKSAVPERGMPGKGRWFSVDFAPDGAHLVAAGERGVVVFRAADGSEAVTLEGAGESPVEARFTPDGKMIASAGSDGILRLHAFPGGRAILAIPADPPIVAFARGVDATLLAWGDGPRIRLAPLDLGAQDRPPAELLRAAQTAAALELRGFALIHR